MKPLSAGVRNASILALHSTASAVFGAVSTTLLCVLTMPTASKTRRRRESKTSRRPQRQTRVPGVITPSFGTMITPSRM